MPRISSRRARAALLVVAVAGLALAPVLASAQSAPNDPLWNDQYGPQQIQSPSAWTKSQGNDVTIAVVDTGVDVDHPDLRGKLVILPGSDFGNNDGNPDDRLGHGTHVAGTAAAITGNGVGVAGVAPRSPIMPIKIWGDGGSMTAAEAYTLIPRAIRFAVDNGAKVINLSIAAFGPLDRAGNQFVGSLETPCTEAFARGALCIIAAGNSGNQPSGYNRNLNAVVVTANNRDRGHADFGQHADTKWSLSAPGVEILSTWPTDLDDQTGYASIQGTSMAAPHVAGVAALLFAQGLSPEGVAERLVATADPMPNPRVNGAGIVNAARAVGATVAVAEGGAGGGAGGPGGEGGSGGGGGATIGGGPGGSGGGGSVGGSGPGGSDDGGPPVTLDDLGDVGVGSDTDFDLGAGEAAAVTRDTSVKVKGGVVLGFAALLTLLTAGIVALVVRRHGLSGPTAT